MKAKYLLIMLFALALYACSHSKGGTELPEEDLEAKKMMQGIWLNQDDQDVAFKVKGDTIFYADSTSQPVYFRIVRDSIILYGSTIMEYPILKQTENLFVFKNQNGEEVALGKTVDADSTEFFNGQHVKSLNQNELIKRDTVVVFDSERYHCYVQVNPTTYKVIKSTYNDDGVLVDNFFYDNIVNLHIYHGSIKIFSRDFRKDFFKSKVPHDFYAQSVLSDLILTGIDASGFHYAAILVIPDSLLSYEVQMVIDYAGHLVVS